jgi:tetratricopeptide (TPR) repeat protein
MFIRTGLISILILALVGGCEPSAQKFYDEGLQDYRRGDTEAARGMFRAAVYKAPEMQQAAYYLARCARADAERKFDERDIAAAMRELDEAVFYYGQAIESYPGYAAAVEEKASALELMGRYDEALRLSIWAKDNAGRTIRQLVNVAVQLEQRGDVDAALTKYRQAIAIEPDSALAYAEMGRFFVRMGRTDDGVEALETAYRLNPSEPGVANDLSSFRDQSGVEVIQVEAVIPPESDAE